MKPSLQFQPEFAPTPPTTPPPGLGAEPSSAVPAVVRADPPDAAPAGTGSEVDLLACVLTDVADHHVAVGLIEGEAPGVAQAVGPDLVATRPADEGVTGRNRVGG